MRRIAILSCLRTAACCCGAACFRAFNRREKSFTAYADEDAEMTAFFHCNGCDCDYDNDRDFLYKINRIPALGTEVVHVGLCSVQNGEECKAITKIIGILEDAGVRVVRGTH